MSSWRNSMFKFQYPSARTALLGLIPAVGVSFLSEVARAEDNGSLAATPAPQATEPAPAATDPAPAPVASEPTPTRSASAESETPSAPAMDFSVAPPGPAVQRRDYMHEGFYFRFNVGPGIVHSNINQGNLSGSGGSFAIGADLMLGGSPSPGITLGGGAFTNTAVSVPYRGSNLSQFQFLVGPFFDAYPRNKGGFHFGAAVGLAGSTLDSLPGGPAFGGGGALFTGYDAWVAPEWAAGFFLRGTGAFMAGSDVNTASFGIMAMLTLLHN
jgi:hypothetical protein